MYYYFIPKDSSLPQPLLSLAQVPGLERLPEVCEQFRVEITAFGSVVRRLAKHLATPENQEMPDLFHLAPFLSDIDLYHTGKHEDTDRIREAILGRVPYSECFRWEIFSEAELHAFREDEERLPVIPANKLTLSTRAGSGIQDPFDGIEDIQNGKFRLLLNPFYHRSKLRAQHRDCELLHALFFLQLVCEHGGDTLPPQQPGWENCKALIDASDTATQIALDESAYLRGKLSYRLKALRSVCDSEQRWGEVIEELGRLDSWRFHAPYWFPDLWSPFETAEGRIIWPLVSSCRIGGDVYRLSSHPLDVDASGAEALWGVISSEHLPLNALSRHPIPKLEEGQKLIAASPRFRIRTGLAPSARSSEQVHLEFQLRESEAGLCDKYKLSDLGVLVALTGEERTEGVNSKGNGKHHSHSYVMSLPSVCSVRRFERKSENTSISLMQTRLNFGQVLDVFPDLLRRAGLPRTVTHSLRIFIVGEHE
jgi:hypothetical protein